MSFDLKIGTAGFIFLLLVAICLAMVFGAEVGIQMGRQQMATVCNVIENADCDYMCTSDGCICINDMEGSHEG